MAFDLDDDELKATRKLNGADKDTKFKNIDTLMEFYNQNRLFIMTDDGFKLASEEDIKDYLEQKGK